MPKLIITEDQLKRFIQRIAPVPKVRKFPARDPFPAVSVTRERGLIVIDLRETSPAAALLLFRSKNF